MTERVFVKKLTRAGFNDIEVYGHAPYGNDEVAVYPLLPDQLIEVMRKVLPAERQRHLVTAVVVRARRGVKGCRYMACVPLSPPARVLVDEAHMAITAPPLGHWSQGSHQATARPVPHGD